MTARKVASDFLFEVEDPEVAKLAPAGSVAEGVLMYLNEAEVVGFLAAVHSSTAVGSRVLATYMYQEGLDRESLGWLGSVLTVFLKLAGEPFRWGVQEDGIEPFLKAQGFRILGASSQFDLKQRYLEPAGHGDRVVARLERVVAAESADFPAS